MDRIEDKNRNGRWDEGETDLMKADTDGGGEADGSEREGGRDPFDRKDDMTYDLDNDGLANGEEAAIGTDPANPDTDGDSINDYDDPFPLDARYRKDSDKDGLPDEYEKEKGLDPEDPDDGDEDEDEDGLTNEEEFVEGTDPVEDDSDGDEVPDGEDAFPDDAKYQKDTDEDGMPDAYEEANGLNKGVPSDAGMDADGDGLNNLGEFLYGTDPNNPDSDHDGIVDGEEIDKGTNPLENACLLIAKPTALFTDTLGHWSEDYVVRLHMTKVLPEHMRILDGYGKGMKREFIPNQHISRFELLKIAMLGNCIKLASDQPRLSVNFSDLPSTSRPHEEDVISKRRRVVYTAVREKIVQGYPDNTFRPDDNVNRAEALKILLLSANIKPPEEYDSPLPFSDINPDDWFFPYVKDAIELDVIEGYGDGTFRPANPMTRAEASKILLLLMVNNPMINGYVIPMDF
ncbi:MAG: S-layer homology domain-containing protein [Candidatus Peribacteraceae bacterium]|nr:S-layer homology domain-containing protein [Candidatus Peribacteraceae bacterium]